MRRDNPEERIQIAVACALDAAGVLWMHCPNEGRCSKAEGARRKSRGVKAGVPDVLIFDPPPWDGPWYRGAALELKAERGSASAEQREWMARLATLGWATAIVKGEAEAMAQLRAWGYIR